MADGNLTSYSKLHSYQLYGAAEKSDPRVLAGTGHFMPTEVEVFYMGELRIVLVLLQSAINQSNNRSIDQSINRSIDQSINR